jgi:hypothetical protein
MTEWLRLIRYTSSVIVARSARLGGVPFPDLLPVGSKDGLEEFLAVPDLHGRTVQADIHPAPGPVLAAADLLPGHGDHAVGGDPPGDPVVPGAAPRAGRMRARDSGYHRAKTSICASTGQYCRGYDDACPSRTPLDIPRSLTEGSSNMERWWNLRVELVVPFDSVEEARAASDQSGDGAVHAPVP